jgi:MFS family permease
MFGLIGVIISVNQGVAMKHIWLKHFKEPTLELWTLLIFAVSFLLLSVNIFAVLCITLIFTTLGQSILRVVMTSQVVGKSAAHERGEILGIMSSVASLSMMIGPVLAGFLYENDKHLPFILGSVLLTIAFAVLFRKRRELARMKLPDDVPMESLI